MMRETKEKMVLDELLDRYERSKLFRDRDFAYHGNDPGDPGSINSFHRLRPISIFKTPKFLTFMEDADEKRSFLDALADLKKENIIDFSWVRYEEGNLAEKIWLNTDVSALEKAYRIAGRVPLASELEQIQRQIEYTITEIEEEYRYRDGNDIVGFLWEMSSYINKKRKIPKYFFSGSENRSAGGNSAKSRSSRYRSNIRGRGKNNISGNDGTGTISADKNMNLLKLLAYIAAGNEEQMDRVMSQKLFGDSKYFEHELRTKTVMILKHISLLSDEASEETFSNEDEAQQLLAERGIVKWPQILELRGEIILHMDDGSLIDLSPYTYGACLNSATVGHISSIDCNKICSVISIENKANYTWYISSRHDKGEIVLYTGGFFSPVRGKLFEMIYEGCAVQKNKDPQINHGIQTGYALPVQKPVIFRHWGDIDLGGFRIFLRLKREIFPSLEPYMMDEHTLNEYSSRCIPLGSGRYRKALEKAMHKDEYNMFRDVMSYMLENDVRLEQEALIW